MKTITIVGGGIIGSSWALVFARAGLQVRAFARHETVRAGLVARVRAAAISARAIAPDVDIDELAARISVHASLEEALDGCAYVQELIEENLAVKRDMFETLDRLAPPHAVIASSTSSIGVSRFAADLPGRDRCLVAHPAAPPHLIPVVEIVPAPFTSQAAIDATFALMRDVGQSPVLVKSEQPGFVLNRLQGALLIEMLRVVEDGIMSPEDVDKLICDGFGLRWAFLGPLEGVDLNAPGGIADYLGRYGFMFETLAQERGETRQVVTDAVVSQLDGALRSRFKLEDQPRRIAARDRRMALLRAMRNSLGPAGEDRS